MMSGRQLMRYDIHALNICMPAASILDYTTVVDSICTTPIMAVDLHDGRSVYYMKDPSHIYKDGKLWCQVTKEGTRIELLIIVHQYLVVGRSNRFSSELYSIHLHHSRGRMLDTLYIDREDKFDSVADIVSVTTHKFNMLILMRNNGTCDILSISNSRLNIIRSNIRLNADRPYHFTDAYVCQPSSDRCSS